MVMGLSALRRFLTGVPFIIKIDVVPKSVIACEAAIASICAFYLIKIP